MYRRHHTRKNSRINTNKDLLHVLLISSDPLISTIRLLQKKKLQDLSNETKSLLNVMQLDETNLNSDCDVIVTLL
jgi:hypothetical protein